MVSGESLHAESLHLNASSDELELTADGVFSTGPWVQEGDDATLYLGNNSHFIRSMPFEGIQIGVAGANGSAGTKEAIVIEDWSGKVGIGVGTDHTFGEGQLEVKGTIRSTRVLVEQSNWPDYVFQNEYRLRSLDDLRGFIKDKGHLPDIPSAKEIEAKGLDLGELVKLQMQKIEELTLYVLQLEEKLTANTSK